MVVARTAPAHAHVRDSTHRLIASRFPPVGVFDDLSTDKEELAIAYLLEPPPIIG